MDELINFQLQGNVIPSCWFKTITKNGKADLVAINLLSEIVYWYKPYEVKDEITGQHIGWKNKYAGDLLQKSYASLADQFGLSEKQIRDAIIRLEQLGLITRVVRNIKKNGMNINNVLYIQLNFDKLKEFTTYEKASLQKSMGTPTKKEGYPNKNVGVGLQESMDVPTEKEGHPYENVDTNTETTTEITTKTTTEITNNKNIQSEIVCATSEAPTDIDLIIERWNSNKYLAKITKLTSDTNRYKMLKARMKDYTLDDILKAIDNISKSDWLQGKTIGRNGNPFILTFDWFVRPNNFPKIFEGYYTNKEFRTVTVEQETGGNAFDRLRAKYGGDGNDNKHT